MRFNEFDKSVKLVPGSDLLDHEKEIENRKLFKRFKYLVPNYLKNEEVLIAQDERRIVGVAGLEKSPYEDNVYWIKYVEVDEKYREQKIARKLIEAIFDFARQRKTNLRNSSYSVLGELHLQRIFDQMQTQHPDVGFKEAGDHTLFQEDV